MTTTVRYQYVENTLGAAFTLDNFPYTSDGDDKQVKVVRRIVAAADLGTAAGQLRHASGAIACVVPATSNVLMVEASVQRPVTAIGNMIPYKNITGIVSPIPTPTAQLDVRVALGEDNTIRIIDAGASAGVQLATDDVVIVKLTLGPRENSSDDLNAQ